MESILKNEKVKLLIKLALIAVGIYLAVSYILPIIWPIIAGFLIAKLITPLVDILHKKMQFQRNLATVIVLTVFVVVMTIAGFYIGKLLISQVKNLAHNWNIIMCEVDWQVKRICDGVENGLSLTGDEIYNMVSDGFYSFLDSGKDKVVSVLMNNSVPVFIKLIEGFVGVIVTIMSTFFFIRDEERIKHWFANYPFAKETKYISEKLSFVFKAYLKAQLVIMIGSALICFVGFAIIENPYSLLLAIVIGVMDALPLLGLGIVLLPWAAVLIFAGSVKNAIVLIVTFVLCYILREILEPRLIGDKVGIPPLTSLITIYGGYKLFGIIGVVLGPVAFVLIREGVQASEENTEVTNESI